MQALIVVDVQKDFLPGGALEVPQGDQIIPVVNEWIERFNTRDHLVVASQDWHPPDHGSFASQHEDKEPGDTVKLGGMEQNVWPDHCVQDTEGAEFADGLNTDGFDNVFRKGMDREVDSYSAFFDNGHRHATGLGEHLQRSQIKDVYICGLALDVCVKFTALDARRLGFDCTLIQDGTRGVELEEGDCEKAISEMKAAGVAII